MDRPESTDPSTDRSPLTGRIVLVVDDNLDMREMLTEVLAGAGAVPMVADSGEAALAVAESTRLDALVCDLNMPGMDGHQLLRRVRALPGALRRRVPAIALTGDATWDYRDPKRAITAGFDQHLVKPVLPRDLITVLGLLFTR